jgi:hypothetical protein
MNRDPSGISEEFIGFRAIRENNADFPFLDPASAPSSCGPTACEAGISLAALGAHGDSGTVSMFVRLTNGVGDVFDNGQTLPEDDPNATLTVTEVLKVPFALAPHP